MTGQFPTLEHMIVATAEGVRPRERLTVSEAAAKYVYLKNPGSYVGPYLNEKAPYLVEFQDMAQSTEFTAAVFVGPAQTAKALPLDTPIATPSGWTTMGDLRIGDQIFGSDGKPCRVVLATGVMHEHECFAVEFDDGTELIADGGHLWTVDDIWGSPKTLTTVQIADTCRIKTKRATGRSRYAIPMSAPLVLPHTDLPLDPYLFGIWLGDGDASRGYLNLGPNDAEEIAARFAHAADVKMSTPQQGKSAVRMSVWMKDGRSLTTALKEMGVLHDKHIPIEYLRCSEDQRRELLRGLMDSDGHASHSRPIHFVTVIPKLLAGMRDLLSGLGVKHSVELMQPHFTYLGERREGQPAYRVAFTHRDGTQIFALSRHVARVNDNPRAARKGQTSRRWIRNVRPVDSVPVRCIQVDSDDHLFLAGRQMVATHNTQALLNIIAYKATCDPGDVMVVQTAQSTARDFSKSKLAKLFRDSPIIGAKRTPGRQNRNVYDVEFLSGWRLTLAWPSVNELSGKSIPLVMETDYDRMEQNIDGEGSPFDLGRTRTKSYKRRGMTIAESTPGFPIENSTWMPTTPHEAPPVKGILGLYNRGDRRRWYWHCWGCATAFEPDFKHLHYPATSDHMEAAEAAELVCPNCGTCYKPSQKHEINGQGKWIKEGQVWMPDKTVAGTALRSDIASFWLKGVCAAFADWKTLVFNYLKAQQEYDNTGNEEPLKVTTNVDQGHPYTPKASEATRLPEDLKARRQDWGGSADEPVVPEGVRFMLATVDVQLRAFVVQVHGFHANGDISLVDMFKVRKSARVDAGDERLQIDPANYAEDWQLLVPEVIEKTYPLADGSSRRMAIKGVACDSGGRAGVTPNAYGFWRWLRDGDAETVPCGHHARFMLVKGASSKSAPRTHLSFPDSDRKDRTAGARGEIPVLLINTDMLKDQASAMIGRAVSTDAPVGGMVQFPVWAESWLYTQLTAEIRLPSGWSNPAKKRNEAWDLLVYALALALSRIVQIEQIDWSRPPGWAEEWARNDLVFGGTEPRPFEREAEDEYDLAKLAEDMA